jgi:hypothetical protein
MCSTFINSDLYEIFFSGVTDTTVFLGVSLTIVGLSTVLVGIYISPLCHLAGGAGCAKAKGGGVCLTVPFGSAQGTDSSGQGHDCGKTIGFFHRFSPL